jgi:hypothetical protein
MEMWGPVALVFYVFTWPLFAIAFLVIEFLLSLTRRRPA